MITIHTFLQNKKPLLQGFGVVFRRLKFFMGCLGSSPRDGFVPLLPEILPG